jgi:hypothetical protein
MLFQRNNGAGLCERCLVFRLSHYLQNHEKLRDYFVDCDFNSHFYERVDRNGNRTIIDGNGKPIQTENGKVKKIFVDIIIHKRDFTNARENDFICLEIKKWNNNNSIRRAKDIQNLKAMTSSQYAYKHGFYITLGKRKEDVFWSIFRNGRIAEENTPVFPTA